MPTLDKSALKRIIQTRNTQNHRLQIKGLVGLNDDPEIRGKRANLVILDDLNPPVDTSKMVFVFGSNLAGVHGAGAAKYALRNKGALRGFGIGHYGQSFAIPTKDRDIQTLPLSTIQRYVAEFIAYAKCRPELTFQVTAIGCGLAGFRHEQIAPMFADAPCNCYFDTAWKPWLPDHWHKFWGTF